jgi:glutamyl-tRNA(Gln) amidotransferase subunit D
MPGTKTRKLHTSRRDAFKIINSEPFAEISKLEFKILRNFNARDNSKKVEVDSKFESRIAFVKIVPGQNPNILDWYVQMGYKGIILEIAGIGQVPTQGAEYNWLPTIKRIVDRGIFICATPQTIFGRLNPNVYSAGRELQETGVIFLEDMLSETAFVKLGWVLGHSSWVRDNKVKEKMIQNFSREITERTGVD